MGKRRKRKMPETSAPYLRKPTHQGKLTDSIDREKYNLVDISGSDTDNDIPIVKFSSHGSKYEPPNTDMHGDYYNYTTNKKINLNHSKFSPAKDDCNMGNMHIIPPKGQGSKQLLVNLGHIGHSRGQSDQSKYYSLNLSEPERRDDQSVMMSRYEAAAIQKSKPTYTSTMSRSYRSRSPKNSRSRSGSPRISRKSRSSASPSLNKIIKSRSRSSEISRSRSHSPKFSGHRSPTPELSILLRKYSALTEKKGPDVANVLKSVVASVLSAPDVKSIISSIPAGKSRDELLKGLIEEQLAQSVAKNPSLLKQITGENNKAVFSINDSPCDHKVPAEDDESQQVQEKPHISGSFHSKSLVSPDSLTIPVSHLNPKYAPLESTPEQPKLSLLGSYIKNLFDKKEIKYRDEDSTEENVMLLIDYQAKYLLRDGHQRILPLMQRKADINQQLYCGNCRQELVSLADKCTHEKSYLHQMITGEWWTMHAQPPKYLPMFINNVRCGQIFIWCIICFEKHGVDTNEQLFQHLKSSHHQFNMYCWKECYNAWPLHEWCLWKDVESVKHSLPRSTVNGFDWPKQVELCILPDYKV